MTSISPSKGEDSTAAPVPAGLGVVTGTLLIVASMIGTGVFTTTGFMVDSIPSPPAVLFAWICGGVVALCGALTYAELGAALPRNGGEYYLLSRIYHPAVGFAAGWITFVVGFSAPLASFALAFGNYLQAVVPDVPPVVSGLCLIAGCAVMHSLHLERGTKFHNASTLGKIGLILLFIVAGLFWGQPARLAIESNKSLSGWVLSPPFAQQLVYVSFAYSGWNTAAYLAGEFRRPDRDILRSVLAGTGIVAFLYLGLNVVFLMSTSIPNLASPENIERVGHAAAISLFGDRGGRLVDLLIVIGLVSTVSANLMAGPRVYEAMGNDYRRLRFLTSRRAGGGPVVAIFLQATLAAIMVVACNLQALLGFISITLGTCAAATVAGSIVLRCREPDLPRPYRTWGYPLTPVVFLLLEGWMIVFFARGNLWLAAASVGTIAVGLIGYLLVRNSANE